MGDEGYLQTKMREIKEKLVGIEEKERIGKNREWVKAREADGSYEPIFPSQAR